MKRMGKHILACLLAFSITLMGIWDNAFVIKANAENVENEFELTGYSNIVRNHIPEPMGTCRTSFLGKGTDSGYQVAVYDQGKIYIRDFSSTYQVESSKELELELSIWGGIYLGESYNYVICGEKRDTKKADGGEVYRIIKYSKDFERIDSISLNSEDTYTALPFNGGNISVDESGNTLTVYTSRLRLDGHQSNIVIHINTSDMTLADKEGIASFPNVHVSHSVRQLVKYDDEPVYVDVSDGYPQRSIYLHSKNKKKALLDIAGEEGDNVTDAELSGLAISDTNYLVVGSYVNQNSNNIFLSSMDKKSGEVKNQWLTNSSIFAPKYFHNPRIVKIAEDKFVVMWGSDRTQYILVDGKGEIISELKESPAPITDCEPIYDNGRILCLSVEKGLMEFHELTDFSSNGIYKPETTTIHSGSSWDGTTDTSWYAASKTEFDISAAEQLAGLAQLVNDGNTFEGKKINLCQDIFLNDDSYQYVWEPIAAYVRNDASNPNVFQGTFCGNGHTIYNMRTSYNNNGGLFGRIGENGSVKCVDISQGRLNSGGCIANVNEGIISFCNNYSCTGGEDLYAVGGICNFNSNLVYGCKNFGEVWGSCPAGIVGLNKEGMSVVSQCSNHGLVGGNGDVAGIVYLNWGWLYNCYSKGIIADAYLGMGNMYDRARSLAGIVHENNDYGIVENCYFAGTFSYLAGSPWMGVCGISRQNNGREITNCYSLSGRGQYDRETISYEELADPSFVQKLDQQKHSVLSVWRADVNKINGGLPITVADESSFTGQCKIQPEAWILGGKKVIEANLEDGKYQLKLSCYYNDDPPVVTVGNPDIAEISEDNMILFKKAGTTPINIHFNETENNSSADYQLTLRIEGTTQNIAQAEVSLSQNRYIYDGKAKIPSVTVKLSGKTLVMDTDYTVSYSNNINVGTAGVTITGIGSYAGTITKNFTIIKKEDTGEDISKVNISKAAVTLSQDSYTYDGWEKKPSVTVKLNGKTLRLDKDYQIIYSNNIDVGTAKAVIIGKGGYTGNISVYFTIVKAEQQINSSISCNKTLYKTAYGAKPFKINVASKSKLSFISSNPKIADVDKNTGTVTIKGTGVAVVNVTTGKHFVKVTVKVSPKKQSLKSVKTAKGRKLIIKWAKDKNAAGYQVQISMDKNFKKISKQKNVTRNSYTAARLKAGKKYYVRVRSYKKSGMETLYGAWSKVKRSGKVKK